MRLSDLGVISVLNLSLYLLANWNNVGRYIHFTKAWRGLVNRSPSFATYLEKTLYNNIVYDLYPLLSLHWSDAFQSLSVGKQHLAEDPDGGEALDGFDYAAMEEFAQKAQAAQNANA